jgi:mevalonate kinase
LMMNVMTVRQCYEWHEIIEMKWVHEINNSFDSMTKIKSLSTLKTLIDINQINLDIIKWVERRAIKEMINQMTKKND